MLYFNFGIALGRIGTNGRDEGERIREGEIEEISSTCNIYCIFLNKIWFLITKLTFLNSDTQVFFILFSIFCLYI